MHVIVGIVLLLGGIGFPIGLLVWLNGRMRRQPPLGARQVGMILALNGVLPVGLILAGLGLISPRFGAGPGFRVALLACALAAMILLAGLWWTSRSAARTEKPDGR